MSAMHDRLAGLLLACVIGALLSAHPASLCAAAGPASPVVATNFALVTNIVVITNYVVTTNVVLSTNGPALKQSKSVLPDLSWVPPADTFDWIQLKSGEWLKGRVKAMQDRTLEFDSEELDDLTFDWKDIRQLRSSRTQDVLFVNQDEVSGPVIVTPGHITVGGATPRTFSRDDLQSITPGGSKERNYWSGKLSAGLTVSSGNTKSVDYNAQATLQRRTPATRFKFDYLGVVSSVDDVESANNHRAGVEFDYWLSRRLYLVVPYAEYFRDRFQNIDRRVTGVVGLGYDIVDRPTLEWNITAGPAYQYTWFDSVQPGEDDSRGTGALSFGSQFDWDITRRIDLILEYRGQYTSREVGETIHHSVSTLSIELTKRFDLDVSFVWDRTQHPKPDSNGDVPKQDDFRLIVGLGVTF